MGNVYRLLNNINGASLKCNANENQNWPQHGYNIKKYFGPRIWYTWNKVSKSRMIWAFECVPDCFDRWPIYLTETLYLFIALCWYELLGRFPESIFEGFFYKFHDIAYILNPLLIFDRCRLSWAAAASINMNRNEKIKEVIVWKMVCHKYKN